MVDLITTPPKPNPHASRLNISCGDCIFFSSLRLPQASASCSGLGCHRSRAPCLKFSPNVFTDAIAEDIDAKGLRKALNAVSDASAGALAMALAEIPRLRAAGFALGQKVYFNAVGQTADRDYVANYYAARVMRIDHEGNLLVKGDKVSATIALTSVLTIAQWKEKRKALVAKRAIFDPKSPYTWERKDEKLFTNPKYQPPWLEKQIALYRTSYLEAKSTRQTHDYDAPPVKRGRGRPRKDGSPAQKRVKAADVSAVT
jgi:hypothetical protein